MNRNWLWSLAKTLEGLGMVVVLVGLVLSVNMGMHDETMKSMQGEAWGLAVGGLMFLVGWLIERSIGAR